MRDRFANWPQLATLFVFALALGYLGWLGWGMLPSHRPQETDGFDGDRALVLANDQCKIGPRPLGSANAWTTGDMIMAELKRVGWETAAQEYVVDDLQLRNIAGMAGKEGPLLVIATHYDTSRVASQDEDLSPGGNNGASGVAVLLELARALNTSSLQHRVWLLFLDGEADPGQPGWDRLSGARHFMDGRQPQAVIYLDMVGATDARFPMIPDATDLLQTQLWKIAGRLGYGQQFVPDTGQQVRDAHVIFLEANIPTAEIIQPDYPYARSPEDTCERLDADTLTAVGVLLESYLENGSFLTVESSLQRGVER
jgi:hypothetical protein